MKTLLIVLGFPLWFPLLLAAFVIILSLAIVTWAVVISFWSVFASFIAAALAGAVIGVLALGNGDATLGLVYLSIGAFLLGLALYLMMGCITFTRRTTRFAVGAFSKVFHPFR